MGNLRPVLIIGLVFLAYMLWVEWQKDYGPGTSVSPAQPAPYNETDTIPSAVDRNAVDVPRLDEAPGDTTQKAMPQNTGQQDVPSVDSSMDRSDEGTVITVLTDVLDVEIDLQGGTVVSARLLDYPVVHEDPDTKVNLLSKKGDNLFIAQSGLLSEQPAPNHTSQFRSARLNYELSDGVQEIRVPLSWESQEGIRVTKTFIFKRKRYDIEIQYQL